MFSPPPRYCAELDLPAARYVPGRTPELPRPAGPELADPLDAQTWPHCRNYLHGIDLFNHGFYWEAHEVWEGLWHQAGRSGARADFLKALIKLAAAGVKHHQGNDAGRRSNASRSAELFGQLAGPHEGAFLGLLPDELAALASDCAAAWPTQPLLLPRLPSSDW